MLKNWNVDFYVIWSLSTDPCSCFKLKGTWIQQAQQVLKLKIGLSFLKITTVGSEVRLKLNLTFKLTNHWFIAFDELLWLKETCLDKSFPLITTSTRLKKQIQTPLTAILDSEIQKLCMILLLKQIHKVVIWEDKLT